MRADFDSEANALSIDLVDARRWEGSEGVGQRVNVAFANGEPVNSSCSTRILGLSSRYMPLPIDLSLTPKL